MITSSTRRLKGSHWKHRTVLNNSHAIGCCWHFIVANNHAWKWFVASTQINDLELDASRGRSVEKFKLRITEKGTRFDQKIYIDKNKQAEYFKAPAHNGNEESDYMFDFKMVRNIIPFLKLTMTFIRKFYPTEILRCLEWLSHDKVIC